MRGAGMLRASSAQHTREYFSFRAEKTLDTAAFFVI
jgi:hypothetical protein